MNWDEVKEMARNKISFGGHTKSHVYLPSVDEKDILWDEIAGCKNTIEYNLKKPADYFCFPLGGFTEEAKILVQKAGYKGAVTTNRGHEMLNRKDLYELKRISIRNGDPYFSSSNFSSPFRFRAKLSGYYNLYRLERFGN
jgi:peptidoglycan/xylan/chitin deacetylase (PgdA/CDA1 family)